MPWPLMSFYPFLSSVITSYSIHYTKLYEIRKGDSLYTIAKKFRVSTQDLQKENRVSAKNLKPGTKLVIPEKDHHPHTMLV